MRYVASTQDGWKYRDLLILDPFWPSSLFYSRILIYMGFGGPVIKEGIILVISIVTLQNCFWRPRWDMWQVPKMAESTGTSWYWTLFDPVPYSIYIYWYIWVLGARYKRGSNLSYLDCYSPKLFWRPRWDMWQVPKMADSTGTSWYWTLFDPVPYFIRIYWYIWVLGGPL